MSYLNQTNKDNTMEAAHLCGKAKPRGRARSLAHLYGKTFVFNDLRRIRGSFAASSSRDCLAIGTRRPKYAPVRKHFVYHLVTARHRLMPTGAQLAPVRKQRPARLSRTSTETWRLSAAINSHQFGKTMHFGGKTLVPTGKRHAPTPKNFRVGASSFPRKCEFARRPALSAPMQKELAPIRKWIAFRGKATMLADGM
jgi:hypothetical protein